MKKTTLKLLSLLIAFVTLVSVVSCSAETGSETEVTDTDGTSEQTSATPAPDDPEETTGADVTSQPDEADTEQDQGTTVTPDSTEPEPDEDTSSDAETERPDETVTEAPAPETTTAPPVTEAPTTTAPVTTAPVTTAPTTTAPVTEPVVTTSTPAQKTSKPKLLSSGSISSAGDRMILFGEAEDGSVIRWDIGGHGDTEQCNHKYFYIEISARGKTEVTLYATAPGKKESDGAKYTVECTTNPKGVWGGKNSRIFYMPTLDYLLGNKADEASLQQLTGYIANKTITEIQKATGKDTKLIYAVIPDPATCYYDEQRDYVQNAVQIPPTTAMQSFVSAINGVHKDVYAVDLLTALRKHKDERIYFSTDTHYTEYGAYYAYLEIMNTVKKSYPGAKVRTLEGGDYKVEWHDVAGGDLVGISGVPDMREVVPFFVANFSDTGSYYTSKRNDGIKAAGFGPGGWERNSTLKSSSNPTAYFLGDSYGCYILPFIGANFSKVWTNSGVLWNYQLDKNILAQNKPDYVILLVCQRNVSPNFMDSNNLINMFSMSVAGF